MSQFLTGAPLRRPAAPFVLLITLGCWGAGTQLGCSDAGDDASPAAHPSGTGGESASGGFAETGGDSAGGESSGSGGSDPGTGGSGAGTETGGSSGAPTLSLGCGKSGGLSGARTVEVNGQTGNFIISVPSDYSTSTPYPLGFAFHGYGRTHENCQENDCAGFQSVMGEEAVLVYMKSFTDGWEQEEIRNQNADFFEQVLDLVQGEFCTDTDRVFVAGTSSGASFSNVLACRFGDRLLASVPVAGWLPEDEGCVGQLAVAAIHGIDDPHVTFESGETARDFFLAQNGCTNTTVPELEGVHAEIRASRDIDETNQKCVDYQGCDAGFPVRWCEHSEGGYDDSTHGWPTAGGQMIWDFVSSL